MTGNFWTAEEDAKLTELWSTELSAAQIGKRIRKTKNAVIGRAGRIGLPRRQTPIKPLAGEVKAERDKDPKAYTQKIRRIRTGSVARPERCTAVAAVIQAVVVPEPVKQPVRASVGRDDGCLWPGVSAGEAPCAEMRLSGKPYCPAHCCRAYVGIARRAA